MFRASQCSSSGDRIILIRHLLWLVCVSDCLVGLTFKLVISKNSSECIYVVYDWQNTFISRNSMQPLISVLEMQCEILVLSAAEKSSIVQDNQWPLRCTRQPQKKRTLAPLELSFGTNRVDTCWRLILRTLGDLNKWRFEELHATW